MKIDIEAMAKESGMDVSMWSYGAGSIVFTMGTDGVSRGAVERFARLILERCAQECDAISADKWALYKGRSPYTGIERGRADPDTQGQSDGADECATAIRNLLEPTK